VHPGSPRQEAAGARFSRKPQNPCVRKGLIDASVQHAEDLKRFALLWNARWPQPLPTKEVNLDQFMAKSFGASHGRFINLSSRQSASNKSVVSPLQAEAERECILAAPGEKQQACGPLESLQTLVREGSAQGVSAVLANIRAASRSKKARKASDAKRAAALESEALPVMGEEKQSESDRAEFEVPGGRSAVAMAGGGDPRSDSNSEEWENRAAEAAAEGMEDRLQRWVEVTHPGSLFRRVILLSTHDPITLTYGCVLLRGFMIFFRRFEEPEGLLSWWGNLNISS
jgi:hypothetical protein